MKGRLEPLTSLRFVAASGILLHHFGAVFPWLDGARTFLESLSSCVSFFFVLSGFILVHAYQATDHSIPWGRFFQARLARVYPLYLLAMLPLIPTLVRHGAPIPGWTSADGFWAIGSSVVGVQAWIPKYANLLNPPGWSLSAELFFYALFPMVAKWGGKALFHKPWTSLAVLWITATTLSLILEMWVAGDRQVTDWGTQFASFSPLVRLPEFLMGMSLAALFRRWEPRTTLVPTYLWVLGTLALLVALWIGAGGIWRTAFHNSLLSPLFGMIVLGFAKAKDPVSDFLGRPLPLLLGEASYALYILHIPLFYVLVKAIGFIDPEASRRLSTSIVIVASVPVAIIAHLWFEKPLQAAIRNWGRPA